MAPNSKTLLKTASLRQSLIVNYCHPLTPQNEKPLPCLNTNLL